MRSRAAAHASFPVFPLLAVLAWAGSSSHASAQSSKLNLPLPRDANGEGTDVSSFRVDPSGRWALFAADTTGAGCHALYLAPLDGSAPPRERNEPFAPGGSVASFAIDPRGEWVLYSADPRGDDVIELYSVPLDGSAPPRVLSGPLVAGGDVGAIYPVGDGLRVVFSADRVTDGAFDLWSVPLDGSAPPIQLNVPGGAPESIHVAPGGLRVVYADVRFGAGARELWSTPVDASVPPVRLNALPAFAGASEPVFSPDGAWVLYTADARVDEQRELWSVPIDGSLAPACLNGPLIARGDAGGGLVSPDSRWVVYTADATRNEVYELYRVPIEGGAAPRVLSGSLVSGGSVSAVRFDGDGSHVVYRADAIVAEQHELWSVPADGSAAPLRLNDPLASSGDVAASFEIDAAGERVVYLFSRTGSVSSELYCVAIDRSSEPRKLDAPAPADSPGVESFRLAAQGGLVAYRNFDPGAQAFELWSVPTDGNRPALCIQSAQHLNGLDWSEFLLTADGARAIYRADLVTDELFELWSRPTDASTPAVRLSPPLLPDAIVGDIEDYQWVPDSRRVVYRGVQEWPDGRSLHLAELEPSVPPLTLGADEWSPAMDPAWNLHLSADGRWLAWAFWMPRSVPLDASEPADAFHGPIAIPGHSDDVAISPGGKRVVFVWRAHPPFQTSDRLYGAPIDRRSGAIELGRAGRFERFVIAPRGERMVTLERTNGRPYLRSASITARIPPRTLHAPLGPERSIDRGYRIGPDGAWVVFVADVQLDDVFELYGARLGVEPGPVRLSPPLGPGGDVDGALRITPDGKRVVFVADALVDETFELFSAPLDGSAPAVRLSGTLVEGGDVARGLPVTDEHGLELLEPQFELTNDGRHVVYRADADQDEVFELFAAPLDGSAPPHRLHPSLAPAGDVVPFSTRLTPDGRTVVWAADALADERLEVFAVPLEGALVPQRLSPPSVPGGALWSDPALGARDSLQLSADGLFAVFLADAREDETFELWAARLAGGRARILNGPLVAGGDVGGPALGLGRPPPFRLSPDGRTVAYLADLDEDEVFELYASDLAPGGPKAAAPAPRSGR